jgi:hypothetical protein
MNQPPARISQLLDIAADHLAASWQPTGRLEQSKATIRAWRSAKQARDELDAWTYAPSTSPFSPTKSEQNVRIDYIPTIDGKPAVMEYTLGDLDQIEYWLENGRDGMSAEQLFSRGWFFDGLQRLVRERIMWDKMHLRLLAELPELR